MTDTTKCPQCGSTGQVELQMRNKNGPAMTMLSCSRCENRTWMADGEPLSREAAIAVVSGSTEFALAPKKRKSSS